MKLKVQVKKLLKISSVLFPFFIVASCSSVNQTNNNQPRIQNSSYDQAVKVLNEKTINDVSSDDYKQYLKDSNFNPSKWDAELTIAARYFNPLFDKAKRYEFENNITSEYNKLKNQIPELKDLPDVFINLKEEERESTITSLNDGNKTIDFSTLPYYSLVKKVENDDFQSTLVAQSKTLDFIWDKNNDFAHYQNGTKNDPLINIASAINRTYGNVKINGKNTPFNKWDINRDKDTLKFDGSKFNVFYHPDQTTYVYRGVILISGTPDQLTEIRKAWDDKNWDEFKKFGIVYQNENNGGKYKYQVAILAKQFKKTIPEINRDLNPLQGDKTNVLAGQSPAIQIGKFTKNLKKRELDRSYNIGFEDEGSFNWTLPGQAARYFDPDDGKTIETLIVTNPAPYDVTLARNGLLPIQAWLMKKALENLPKEENTYGLYTGYNEFVNIDKNKFINFILLQKNAEGIANVDYKDLEKNIEN